jgi:hypothetical protein
VPVNQFAAVTRCHVTTSSSTPTRLTGRVDHRR